MRLFVTVTKKATGAVGVSNTAAVVERETAYVGMASVTSWTHSTISANPSPPGSWPTFPISATILVPSISTMSSWAERYRRRPQ